MANARSGTASTKARLVDVAGPGRVDEAARAAVKGLRCTICRKSEEPRLPRPGRIRETIGQFNEVALADIGFVKDSTGATFGFLIMIDDWDRLDGL